MDFELLNAGPKTQRFTLKGKVLQAKCVSVYDGDTAQFAFRPIEGAPVYRFTCRMFGYNSGEIHGNTDDEKQYAQVCKEALKSKILNKIVTLSLGDFDKYGRPLVSVVHDELSINDWMLESNYGKPYFGEGEKPW